MFEKLHSVYPELYGQNYSEEEMDARFSSLCIKHKELFGIENPMLFSAAGRSEIAGNHTDHNLGLVLGATINLDTIAAVSKRDDDTVILSSEGFDECRINLSELEMKEEEKQTTNALIRGIARAFKDRGIKIKGWQANTSTNVLKGSGLSSSAAIEVLCAEIFNSLYNDDALDAIELAKIGQFAENAYFGKPSGLLDQICCAHGKIVGIDFKDKENPIVTPLNVDFSSFGYSIVITDTKGDHANLTSDYAAVPSEMRAIAEYYGKENLRDVDPETFFHDIPKLRKYAKNDRAILRAYHYFTENSRVVSMLDHLKKGEISSYLALVKESGNSSYRFLQNAYPQSMPQMQGISIAIACSERVLKDEGAVRVHGGGFAGTIQAYVPDKLLNEYIQSLESVFGENCSTVVSIRRKPVSRIY